MIHAVFGMPGPLELLVVVMVLGFPAVATVVILLWAARRNVRQSPVRSVDESESRGCGGREIIRAEVVEPRRDDDREGRAC